MMRAGLYGAAALVFLLGVGPSALAQVPAKDTALIASQLAPVQPGPDLNDMLVGARLHSSGLGVAGGG